MSEESILILADPNGKAWDFAETIYRISHGLLVSELFK